MPDTVEEEVAPVSALPIAAVPEAQVTEGGKDWSKALVIAGGPGPDAGEKRPVIVCEVRDDEGALGKAASYPTGADLYVRSGPTDDSATFAAKATVVTLGID